MGTVNDFKPRTTMGIVFHIIFTVIFILLILFGIGYCFAELKQFSENKMIESRDYSENNPSVTIIDNNTLEISFGNLARPEARANYLRVHNYEIISASKDRFGATMYIVKVKRNVE